jgi:hypothetical protein
MEYIERELAKENEKNLCANEKCTSGEEGKRKKLGFNMEIVQSGPHRFCSRFCASQYSLGRRIPATGGERLRICDGKCVARIKVGPQAAACVSHDKNLII